MTRRRGKNAGKRFIETAIVERDVRKTMRPRFKWRPYVLRAFFDTQLLIAESRGCIARDFRAFFMGHKGSIEATYTTNKGILPKALLKEMSDAFKRSEEFLDLEKAEIDPIEKQKEDVKEQIAEMTPEQLAEVQKLLSVLNGGKTEASNGLLLQMMQKSTSGTGGNTSETCPMEKSLSENRFRLLRKNGSTGINDHIVLVLVPL